MRWREQRESTNIEDRRGLGPVDAGTGIGLGGIVLVLIVSFLTGTNPLALLNMVETVQEVTSPPEVELPAPTGPPADELGKFAAVVLADTEDTWKAIFNPKSGRSLCPTPIAGQIVQLSRRRMMTARSPQASRSNGRAFIRAFHDIRREELALN
jgi:predicted metalloprotease